MFLGWDFTTNNILCNIIFLGKVEEFADLVGTLWSESFWDRGVGEAWNIGFSLLGDD